MITVKNPITGSNNPDSEINSFSILLELRDLLQAIDGKIDSNFLWNFIQKRARENEEDNYSGTIQKDGSLIVDGKKYLPEKTE